MKAPRPTKGVRHGKVYSGLVFVMPLGKDRVLLALACGHWINHAANIKGRIKVICGQCTVAAIRSRCSSQLDLSHAPSNSPQRMPAPGPSIHNPGANLARVGIGAKRHYKPGSPNNPSIATRFVRRIASARTGTGTAKPRILDVSFPPEAPPAIE